jgi:hypothetical protein
VSDVKKRCDGTVIRILNLIDSEVAKLQALSKAKKGVPLRADVMDAAGVDALCSLAKAAAALRRSEPVARGAHGTTGDSFPVSDLTDDQVVQELRRFGERIN